MGAKSSKEKLREAIREDQLAPSKCMNILDCAALITVVFCSIMLPCLYALERNIWNKGTMLPTAQLWTILGWYEFLSLATMAGYVFLVSHRAYIFNRDRVLFTCMNLNFTVLTVLLLFPAAFSV